MKSKSSLSIFSRIKDKYRKNSENLTLNNRIKDLKKGFGTLKTKKIDKSLSLEYEEPMKLVKTNNGNTIENEDFKMGLSSDMAGEGSEVSKINRYSDIGTLESNNLSDKKSIDIFSYKESKSEEEDLISIQDRVSNFQNFDSEGISKSSSESLISESSSASNSDSLTSRTVSGLSNYSEFSSTSIKAKQSKNEVRSGSLLYACAGLDHEVVMEGNGVLPARNAPETSPCETSICESKNNCLNTSNRHIDNNSADRFSNKQSGGVRKDIRSTHKVVEMNVKGQEQKLLNDSCLKHDCCEICEQSASCQVMMNEGLGENQGLSVAVFIPIIYKNELNFICECNCCIELTEYQLINEGYYIYDHYVY
ncbi:hypothetical protein FG379_003510 [Cryptosporidium bovis]|uniref:uncharacterized protein n=1 Tax=Cryptosporidium bovis TaxID=310047 RepID=UPI00351A128B|nr:hypothetical protein FG379_003510 [Cryptosporidium bovis]